ncbi:DUF5132 domain-containing protein [Desulforhabdus amnigena]|jgi:hypothetical protein|uniref:DUF5132 domain-containing protein n=1 Tax=Desulforhabdus amnigena TaxID=40218 RepID=A0A9W6CZJ6_9BACT|nr:DUF5132 domain-containing protein [Desulforhabdus amnigena]NLJ26451.1 DUF5132 domain-containing protein [Deltaproteobacteria bacterium]GLI34666.1 hypothetical protein DAMNIGENAA_20990 [Desulforhabdus amnigena]
MALFDNGLKMGTGIAVGIGALILAPVVLPVVGSVVKPLLKATIKGGIILFEKGREAIAETAEVLEDIAAEAKAELIKEQTAEASTPSGE